MQLSLRAVYIF